MTRDTNLPYAIATRESALCVAMLALDHAAVEQILAADLSYVHYTIVAESKAAYLAGPRNGLYKDRAITERGGGSARMLGNAALSTGVIEMRVGAKGAAKGTVRLRYALVWVEERAIWRLLLRQATRIPLTADHATEA